MAKSKTVKVQDRSTQPPAEPVRVNINEAQTKELLARKNLSDLLGYSHSGKRNLYQQFGYPKQVSIEDLFGMSERNDIADRIVSAFPQATWRVDPIIYDDEGETDQTSVFCRETEEFFTNNRVFHYLERVDRLANIGQYSILVMGFADGKLSDPLESGDHQLLYMQPYKETNVNIETWVEDEQDPRYGLPETYRIINRKKIRGSQSVRQRMKSVETIVHHSRVIHVAEFLEQDDVFGKPKLLAVYNRMKDLEKVLGSGAELFWLNGRGGMAFWADKEAKLSPEDRAAMKNQAEEYQHEMTRILTGSGITAQLLNMPVPEISNHCMTQLDFVAGTVGIPKRILLGSERGELSSAQDENNFAKRTEERRKSFALPVLLRPLIHKLIDTGNLPQPKGTFRVKWPEDSELTELDKAEIAAKRSSAIATYSNSIGADLLVPPGEFREVVLGMDAEPDYDKYGSPAEFDEPGFDENSPETPDDENETDDELPPDEEQIAGLSLFKGSE